LRSSCIAPQSLLTSYSFVHRHRLQLVHDAGAHLYQSMPMPQQLAEITIIRSWYPYPRKTILPK